MARRRPRFLDLHNPRSLAEARRRVSDLLQPSAEDELEEDVLPTTAQPLKLTPITDALTLTSGSGNWATGSWTTVLSPGVLRPNDSVVAGLHMNTQSSNTKEYVIELARSPDAIGGSASFIATIPFQGANSVTTMFPLAISVAAGEYLLARLSHAGAGVETLDVKIFYYDTPLDAA